MASASVLLVGIEAMKDFSRYTPIVRGDSMYENAKEYERDAVTGATLKPRNINKTVGIAYSHTL